MKRYAILTALFIAALLYAPKLEAATITVCSLNCTYTPSQLQTALNAAVPGDLILLEPTSYVGAFVLRQKSCPAQNTSCYIEIRTGVTSTGVTISTGTYPATGIRITRTQASLATFTANANNILAIRTNEPGEIASGCTVAPCVAAWYKFRWVKFTAHSYGGNSLLQLGSQTTSAGVANGDTQDNAFEEPHHFIIDQVVFLGNAVTGQERAITVAARDVTITNSYFADFKATSDKQAVWLDNTTGNFTFTNNYLEGSGENLISGGDVPRMNDDRTVLASPAPTTTTFTMDAPAKDFLRVGMGLSVLVGATLRYTHVTAINGANRAQLTVEALSAAPSAGATVNYSVVPQNLTFTKNYFAKPIAWRDPILSTPTSVTANGQTSGGSLAAGTYFYRVVARLAIAGGQIARSAASTEVPGVVETGAAGSVTLSWAAVANATTYYVYKGNSGGQNIRFSVTAPTTTFTDTGASGTTEAVPTSSGTTWMVKNVFELKKVDGALVEGNVFDNSWVSGQGGYGVLFTIANNSVGVNGNDSAVVKNVIFRNNKVRHVAGAFQLTGLSADGDISDRMRSMTISNNIFEDVSGNTYGGKQNIILVGTGTNGGYDGLAARGPVDVTIDHNTFLNESGKALLIFDLYKHSEQSRADNFDFTNNLIRRNDQGLRNIGVGGLETEGNTSWTNVTSGGSAWTNNVVVGATCSTYPGAPASTWCPSEATFQSAFTNYAGGNYRVANTWNTACASGTACGANIDTIEAFTNIALSGDDSGGTPPAVSPTITTTAIAQATKGVAFSLQFAATGGTTPYTWSLANGTTAPTGMSLTSTGILSGTPTAPGSYSFDVRVTSAAAAISTQTFSMSITEILTEVGRPDRVDYVEIAIFRREAAPTRDDRVRVGDIWFDLTSGTLYKCTATSPDIVWTAVGTAGGADLSNLNASNLTSGTVPLVRLGSCGTASSTTFLRGDNCWQAPGGGASGAPSAQTVTMYAGLGTSRANLGPGGGELESGSSSRHDIRVDVENSTQIAATSTWTAACSTSPAAVLRIDYWDGTQFVTTGATTSCATGLQQGTFATLPVAARNQMQRFRAYITDGDSIADPTTTNVQIHFR